MNCWTLIPLFFFFEMSVCSKVLFLIKKKILLALNDHVSFFLKKKILMVSPKGEQVGEQLLKSWRKGFEYCNFQSTLTEEFQTHSKTTFLSYDRFLERDGSKLDKNHRIIGLEGTWEDFKSNFCHGDKVSNQK